jgi:hypothetical protein
VIWTFSPTESTATKSKIHPPKKNIINGHRQPKPKAKGYKNSSLAARLVAHQIPEQSTLLKLHFHRSIPFFEIKQIFQQLPSIDPRFAPVHPGGVPFPLTIDSWSGWGW